MLQTHLTKLDQIRQEALGLIEAARTVKEIEGIRTRYLGRKSELNAVLRAMKGLTALERPLLGERTNETKEALQAAVAARAQALGAEELEARVEQEATDITLPGDPVALGRLHPITQIAEQIEDIFISMGFIIEEGPEIEDDFHNFEALNTPPDHPARDMQATFYLPHNRLLRTQTSAVQIRAMRKYKPPLAVVSLGKTYRVDSDPTHSPMFQQVEGFMIDTDISFGDLKGVLRRFLNQLFGDNLAVRFRPSYFPFTEPSAEVDMRRTVLKEINGEQVETEEWLEVLGAGMIHPRVMQFGGLDPAQWTGFAFGAGIDRLAMLKFGIRDIRVLYENDARFLGQF